MVESIYFLKPAWCGTHFAGLWPEQGFQPVTRATALRRWFVTHPEYGRGQTLEQTLASYAWHCDHHLAHVKSVAG